MNKTKLSQTQNLRRKIVTLSYYTKNLFQKWSSVSERIWGWKEVLGISLRCEWLTQSFREERKIIPRWSNILYSSIDWSWTILTLYCIGDQVSLNRFIQHLSNLIMIRIFERRLKTTFQRHQIRVLFSKVCLSSWCAKAE